MAWNYQQRQVYINSDYTQPTPLSWGQYYVYKLFFTPNITNVTFDFDVEAGNMDLTYPIGFLCENVTDWFNSDQTPNHYLGYVALSTSPLTYDISNLNDCYFVVRPINSGQPNGFARFVLTLGGGGGSTGPTYTAIKNNANSTIEVEISNYSSISYSSFVYYISSDDNTSYRDSYQTAARSHIFTGLDDGTYKIWVTYVYNGTQYPIPNANNDNVSFITIDSGGGPTPSGDWDYGSPIYLTSLSNNYTSSSSYSFTYNDGRLFIITFANSGSARFYSSNGNGRMVAYLGSVNNGFDDTDGVPISYDRWSQNQDGFNIDFYSVTAGSSYYLWVTAADADKTNWGTFYLNIIVPSAPVVYPSYSYSNSENSITLNAYNKGNFLLTYKVRLQSDPNDQSHTLYYTNDLSYTASSLLWDTQYRVNVGYSTERNGDITWIGSNLVTTDPNNEYVYIYDGGRWRKAKPYIYDGSQWRPATAYIYNGSQWKKTTE